MMIITRNLVEYLLRAHHCFKFYLNHVILTMTSETGSHLGQVPNSKQVAHTNAIRV